jgi:hypothetical protein
VAHCQIEVGVRKRPFATKWVDGVLVADIEVISVAGRALFDSSKTGTEMLFDVNTRATRRMRHNQDDFEEIIAELKAQGDVPGHPPSIIPIYSDTFRSGSDTSRSGSGPARLGYAAARDAFVDSFCAMKNSCLCGESPGVGFSTDSWLGCDFNQTRAATYQNLYLGEYILREPTPASLDAAITGIANVSADVRKRIGTVKLADEISIDGALNDTAFWAWCTRSKVSLADLGCTSWQRCPFSPSLANATRNTRLFYWSNKADHAAGIVKVKATVDRLRPLLPNALFGANWAPDARYTALDGTSHAHHYVGWTFQWVNIFRAGALSLPWSDPTGRPSF